MEIFNNVLAFAGVIAVIVTVLVQVTKNAINIPKTIVPLVGIVIGLIVGAIAYPFTDLDLTSRLWSGLFAGFSATGLYELVKPTPGTTKDKNTTID